MKFIQDKVNEQGPFSYTASMRDEANGQTSTSSWQMEESDFVVDPANCRISYQSKVVKNGTSKQNVITSILLKTVESVSVMTKEQELKVINAQAESHDGTYQVAPAFFVLRVKRVQPLFNDLYFHDEGTANRVAKAMLRAVDLCGGSNSHSEPF
jgi:hypothetical protein